MKVLIACEESQVVCKAFRERGHEAYSCDIQECSGGKPEWHILGDIMKVIDPLNFFFNTQNGDLIEVNGWDMMIAFPPCTDLTAMNASHWKIKQADGRQPKAINFVNEIYNSKIPKIAIENPVGALNSFWKKPSQIIQPYYFGDPFMKRTCLWLKNLPRLSHIPENYLFGEKTHVSTKTKWITNSAADGGLHKNSKIRSKTFPGIAKAMAEQWG